MPKKSWHPPLTPAGLAKIALFCSPLSATGHVLRTMGCCSSSVSRSARGRVLDVGCGTGEHVLMSDHPSTTSRYQFAIPLLFVHSSFPLQVAPDRSRPMAPRVTQ